MSQEKQDQRKDQILDAALSVIVKNGYDRSRIDDIVATSSLSKGAIYWYYKSKKEVYLSLVDHWVKKYNAGFIENLEQNNNASEQLKGLFDYFLDQYDNDPEAFKILVEFWSLSGRDKDFNKKLQKVYSDFLEYLIRIIKSGVEAHEYIHTISDFILTGVKNN